jgi:hypothetical protein
LFDHSEFTQGLLAGVSGAGLFLLEKTVGSSCENAGIDRRIIAISDRRCCVSFSWLGRANTPGEEFAGNRRRQQIVGSTCTASKFEIATKRSEGIATLVQPGNGLE